MPGGRRDEQCPHKERDVREDGNLFRDSLVTGSASPADWSRRASRGTLTIAGTIDDAFEVALWMLESACRDSMARVAGEPASEGCVLAEVLKCRVDDAGGEQLITSDF